MKNKYFCVVDIELTEDKEIIQFSATKLDSNFKKVSSINYYIKPKKELSSFVTEFTGITDELLKNKKQFDEVAKSIYNFIKNSILVCHGLHSDYSILRKNFLSVRIMYKPHMALDTVELARLFFPTQKSYRLSDLSKSLNLYSGTNYHNAEVDVEVTVSLLKKIREKISIIEEPNYLKIKKILAKENLEMFKFLNLCRDEQITLKHGNNYLTYNDVKFNKIFNTKKRNYPKKNILFSSIDEQEYAKVFKIKNYEILKQKRSYVPLDIFSLFPKRPDACVERFCIRLYVWILETKTGDFSELNLNSSEKLLLEEITNNIEISSEAYYFNKRNETAKAKKNIITSYENIEYVFNRDDIENHTLIFENKKILGRELNSQNTKSYHYKKVIAELNRKISRKPFDKNLKSIQLNIVSIVRFLHEMYISESIFLYNDSLEFIQQDIKIIKSDIKKSKIKMPNTYKFISQLEKILTTKKDSYKFENLEKENSLYLETINEQKVKSIVDILQSKKYEFLNKKSKLNISCLKTQELVIDNRTQGRFLYIFENNKFRDLNFSKREKKSYVKHINFSSTDSFNELYTDMNRNNKLTYICYSTKDILDYQCYLSNIFDSIIILKDVE
ncbi:exonuclease domain-containing protein [Gemella cuniculi]|uniref:exonuclease domain-containing protein n=1 Tax=Gemella cuniculi TaxID=150240 RepID=UPI00042830B3|nr:exonuclease domain-containing protein [Gemella cuniculi]